MRQGSSFKIVIFATVAALSALVLAYIFASDGNMNIQKVLPRVSSISQQLGSARSLLYKPLAPTASYLSQSQPRTFASSSVNMSCDTTTFVDAIKNRRTIYGLTKKSTISDERIKELLTTALKDVPSSFNSQSTRLVVLLKDQHDKFWEIVLSKLKPIVEKTGGNWEATSGRIAMFQNAYGTVLFYEDTNVTKSLQEKMPAYADKFPQWSDHTSAMHQYMLWTAFEVEGLGANLQHYNPLPDEDVSEVWNVPKEWNLKAQLVFGTPQEGARDKLQEKAQKPIEERLFIHGA